MMDANSFHNKNENDSSVKTLVNFENPTDAEATFGDETLEILKITKTLENASIPCCILGISALKYYGAGRVRFDWEICVPTGMIDAASSLMKSEPYNKIYEPASAISSQLQSMIHTYPRFKVREVFCSFILMPSDDYHFDCCSSVIERSYLGLPYPKLEIFAQSLLEIRDLISLTDLIDGMNLTEEWGQQNLNLSGTQDIAWAKRKNEEIRRLVPDPDESCWYEKIEKPFSRSETWAEIVRTKERRLGSERPKEIYATRFRGHDSQDPKVSSRGKF